MIADLLAGLTEAEIQAIGDGSTTLELEPITRIFSPGDPAVCLYIVYDGEVEILPEGMAEGNKGALLGPGEFFGEIALIEGHSHTSTAVTTKPTSLIELRWDTLEQIMDSNPKLLQNLNRALAERLRQTDKRLMKALLQLAEENGRLYERVSVALAVSKRVGDLLDWGELWKQLLDAALETLQAERGTVYVLNPANNCLEGLTIRGEGLTKISLQRGQGLAGACAVTGEGILVNDAQADSRFYPNYDTLTGFSTRAVICVPFRESSGRILGVIQLINSAEASFSVEDLACLSLFAEQLAIGYERSISARKIVTKAESNLVTEIITGIKNSLPDTGDEVQKAKNERLFKRIDLAYRSDIELSAKPLRFRTFLEKLVREISSNRSDIEIIITRDNLYDGFVTADPDLLAAALEGLILELARGEENHVSIMGTDKGETLNIIIESNHIPDIGPNRQPISFQASRKLAALHGSRFETGSTTDGKFSINFQLPLSG